MPPLLRLPLSSRDAENDDYEMCPEPFVGDIVYFWINVVQMALPVIAGLIFSQTILDRVGTGI